MTSIVNRFTDDETDKPNLSPIYGYWSHPLLPLEQALQPVTSIIAGLDRYIKVAKDHCSYPTEHDLTRDESAAIYIYTMEWGDESLYRLLNKSLREEDRSLLKPWFGYLKLFNHALSKLPNLEKVVWRGIRVNVGQNCKKGDDITWWSVNSCTSCIEVVRDFIAHGSTLFLIEANSGKSIKSLTNFPNEDEVILGLGTRFRIVGNLPEFDGFNIVHLVELDSKGEVTSPTIQEKISDKQLTTKGLVEMAYSHFKNRIQADLTKTIKRNIFNTISNNDKSSNKTNNSIMVYPNGDQYRGSMKDGKKHGNGTYLFANGDVYEGEWVDDQMNGRGTFTWFLGNRYEGQYKNGKMHGRGTFYFYTGEKYEGDWADNMRNGYGRYTWPNGNVYDGPHKNNNFHGDGKMIFIDGRIQKGNWKNNMFTG